MMRRPALLAVLLFLIAPTLACQMRDARGSETGTAAVGAITPDAFSARVAKLAHDSMRGRATPSPELDAAAAWIGAEFQRFGLRPAGAAGGFVERYAVERSQLDELESSGRIEGGSSARLAMKRDFLVIPYEAPHLGTVQGDVIVLAAPQAEGGDPLAGVDLTGKVLVQYSDRTDARVALTLRSEWGARRGLAAVIWVTRAGDDVWENWAVRWNPTRFQLADGARGIPILAVRARAAERIFRASGIDLAVLAASGQREAVVRPAPDLTVQFTLVPRVLERYEAPNVAGVLEGSDPALRNEYVVFSAHMDHVGVAGPGSGCRARNGDSICNGADDDASGTAGVLSLAEAFAALEEPPRRSLIFLTVSGEERGLWGSEYFTEHPPVPIEQLVADINLDMIGRNWSDTIVAIGRTQSDLGATLDRVSAAHPELRMTAVDDLWPQQRFYYRSDHYNFARQGVPILFFFNGEHEDYHQPSDHPDKIDAEKASRIVKLLFWLGLEVANTEQRPKWDDAAYREVVGR